MIFTSLKFLIFYAALLFLLAVFKEQRWRKYLLLLGSYCFYGAWDPRFLILIFVTSVVGFWFGNFIASSKTRKQRKTYLFVSIGFTLSALVYFKYANFLGEELAGLLNRDWDILDITLPVGISFFTFQILSYSIDLYRERIEPCDNLSDFLLFVAFFPQLVAGPIVRASEFLPQLKNRIEIKLENLLVGGQLFLGGALQKSLIADTLSTLADPVFSAPELYSTSTIWLGTLCYTVQIFCDFAGYSLMAIGVAYTLGYRLPENFRMPYLSLSITEFWRRWHMTLSFWLRDYLYISLGGNRRGKVRTYLNLMITMLLGGLWHGASWNFILWGFGHGLALTVHKLWSEKTAAWQGLKENPIYRFSAFALTFFFVVMMWVPFRAIDFESSMYIYHALFSAHAGLEWMQPQSLIVLAIALVWHVAYLKKLPLLLAYPKQRPTSTGSILVLGYCVLFLVLFVPINTSPFIYFQF